MTCLIGSVFLAGSVRDVVRQALPLWCAQKTDASRRALLKSAAHSSRAISRVLLPPARGCLLAAYTRPTTVSQRHITMRGTLLQPECCAAGQQHAPWDRPTLQGQLFKSTLAQRHRAPSHTLLYLPLDNQTSFTHLSAGKIHELVQYQHLTTLVSLYSIPT